MKREEFEYLSAMSQVLNKYQDIEDLVADIRSSKIYPEVRKTKEWKAFFRALRDLGKSLRPGKLLPE
jgi:hypothetical protein